jgi:hypothetical protein
VLSPLCLGLGLLSAEFALCTAGYLIAYAAFVDDDRPARRIAALLPSAAVLGGWALTYRLLGHSAHGSGLYINPMSEPVAFAFELAERGTMLLAGQLGVPPSNLWTWVSRDRQGAVVFAAAVFVWFAVRTMLPVLKDDRRARFWALGLVLSLPPACAAFPEDRLLFFAGIGAMPLVATFVSRCLVSRPRIADLVRAPVVLAVSFLVLHVAVAPALLPYRTLYMYRYDRQLEQAGDTLFRHASSKSDFLVVVNAEDFYFAGMMPLVRVAQGRPPVGRLLTLAGTLGEVELTRLDDRTLRVAPNGGFLSRVLNQIYRSRSHPMQRGSHVNLLGIDVSVSEVDQWGEPIEATFRFATNLDDPGLKWVVWSDGAYRRFEPPAVGLSVVVGGAG